MHKFDFIEVDIPRRVGPLRVLYTVTLTYIFKVNNILMLISQNVRASAKIHNSTLIEFDNSLRMTLVLVKMKHPMTLTFIALHLL